MKVDVSRISRVLRKLKRKDPALFAALQKKIRQIASYDGAAIQHLKNLRYDCSDFKRAQIGSFVLFFRIEGETIIFECFKHHDHAYRR
jgi:mRNA-degrading endonuclease RelE of RelBE toxin-antitoxin system